MQSLARAVKKKDRAGEALPTVWRKLDAAGVKIRRGQMTMLAGAPNSGKSLLSLIMAITMDVPTLYMSADTDKHDTLVRAAAHLSGDTMDQVDADINGYAHWLGQLDNLVFTFDPSPTLDDIDLELRAFEEVWGEPPHLLVIDNLINVQCDDADEFRGMRVVMQGLHHLARECSTAVLVLHHVTGEFDGGDKPPPRRALHGKVSQIPEVVLTMAKASTFIGIAPVKNRSGPADATGRTALWLSADYPRVRVSDDPPAPPMALQYPSHYDTEDDFS